VARRRYGKYGWDWAMKAAYETFGYKTIRPLIARTNHNGKHNGTCCTPDHHDKYYTNLKYNKTEKITEFILREGAESKMSSTFGALI
jgi:hypothetical protein